MNRSTFLIGCVVVLTITGCAKDAANDSARSFDDPLANDSNVDSPDDWVLVFDDELDGTALDTSKWSAREGDLAHKGVLNSGSADRLSVHDGSLFVTANPTPSDPVFPYAAGFIDTGGLFAQTYAKVEFRMRGQYAPGLWYALWGRPWISEVPEIDVEYLAADITQVWFVNHWGVPPIPADDRRAFVTVNGIDITEFHTYVIIWKSTGIEWQIDGKPFMRAVGRGVPHEPMNWIINAWVGGWAGTPNPATIFPSGFEVDYFRVYRLREWTTDPLIRIGKPLLKSEEDAAIDIELADFDRNAHVEVWEGDQLIESIARPPFRFLRKQLASGMHSLRLIGTSTMDDGGGSPRTASMTVDVVIP